MNELDRLLTMIEQSIEIYENIENKDEFMSGVLEGVQLAKRMAERLKNELEQKQ